MGGVLTMVGVMFVVTDLLFGSMAAAEATAAIISGFFIYIWLVMPIRYRLNER